MTSGDGLVQKLRLRCRSAAADSFFNLAGRSGLLDRCALGMDELPTPVPASEHASPAALLIYRSMLVLSFGGGAIGYDSRIPVEADFDVVRDKRVEMDVAGLAVLKVLRPVLDVPLRPVMDEVLVQNPIEESGVRLNESRIEVLDQLRQLALVTGRIAKGLCQRTAHHGSRERQTGNGFGYFHRPFGFVKGVSPLRVFACDALKARSGFSASTGRRTAPKVFTRRAGVATPS